MSFDIKARVSLLINADPHLVFDAWVDPPVMEQWLFKSPTNNLSALTDPQPGGTFSIVERDEDSVITHDGIYCGQAPRPPGIQSDGPPALHGDGVDRDCHCIRGCAVTARFPGRWRRT